MAAQDDFYNAPPRSLNKEKLPNSALLQYLLIRKPSLYMMNFSSKKTTEYRRLLVLGLIHLIQEKRSLDYSPRLGRSSTSSDDDEKPPQKSNAYYDNQFYAPRLGKKSLEFSPRLGRSVYSGNFHIKIQSTNRATN